MAKRKPPPPTSRLERLQLVELLEFRPEQGIIRLHDQRVVILSAAALGLLRKELLDTLGRDAARRLLLRFGFADGYHDAMSVRARYGQIDALDTVRAGPTLHTLAGIVHARVTRTEYDAPSGRFSQDLLWRDSYEAEQHVHHLGTSDAPVCWSLVGYSSGFASACLGHEVYYRETACLGAGGRRCDVTGRDAASWGAELPQIQADFQTATLGDEVERLRDAVSRRVRELDRRERSLERRERELNLVRERVTQHAASQHFVAPVRRCRTCWNSPPASRLWAPRCSWLGRAAPGKSSWSV